MGIFVSHIEKYIVRVKIIDFSFMTKIIKILSKDRVPLDNFKGDFLII